MPLEIVNKSCRRTNLCHCIILPLETPAGEKLQRQRQAMPNHC